MTGRAPAGRTEQAEVPPALHLHAFKKKPAEKSAGFSYI